MYTEFTNIPKGKGLPLTNDYLNAMMQNDTINKWYVESLPKGIIATQWVTENLTIPPVGLEGSTSSNNAYRPEDDSPRLATFTFNFETSRILEVQIIINKIRTKTYDVAPPVTGTDVGSNTLRLYYNGVRPSAAGPSDVQVLSTTVPQKRYTYMDNHMGPFTEWEFIASGGEIKIEVLASYSWFEAIWYASPTSPILVVVQDKGTATSDKVVNL